MSAVGAQIKELKELLDAGALTQEEFAAQKKVILEGSAGVAPVQAGVAVPNDGTKNANNTTSTNSIVVQNVMQQGGGRAH